MCASLHTDVEARFLQDRAAHVALRMPTYFSSGFQYLSKVAAMQCFHFQCFVLQSTWLARRMVDADGAKSLLDESDPGLQWLHAMPVGCMIP